MGLQAAIWVANAHLRDVAVAIEVFGPVLVDLSVAVVVHGPLTSTLLIDFARDHSRGRALVAYEAQARAPLFAEHHFELRGRPAADGRACDLWAVTPDGTVAMSARAELA